MYLLPLMLLLATAQMSAEPVQTVCIDPGHPSEVGSGTEGKHVTEIHIAWVIAKKLEKDLVARGIRVVLTKQSENEFVKNIRRAEIANECHAALLVRIHCDSSTGTGFATYYPDRQGEAHGLRGPDLDLLKKLAPIAQRFHATLATKLAGFLKDNGLKSDTQTAVGAKQRALTASIFSKVPVVLVETCVLTNPHDEALVSTPEAQQRIADALADAVMTAIKP